MCVEKNERADDSRFKSWVQNILGIMVLASLPTVAANLLVDWSDRRRDADRIEELIKRVDELEKWRHETNGNRFRWSDGEVLRQAIASNAQDLQQIKKSMNEHDKLAERYIEKIAQLEKKSHVHRYQVESDK